MKIRVLLADDHKIVRNGLRTLLESQPDLEVVGEAEDGRTTVQMARKLLPDIVIMDIAMPDLNGIEATREITRNLPKVRVITLSMHSEKRFVGEMLKAGACGYLLKDCAFEELITAIRSVYHHKTYLSPMIGDLIVNHFVRTAERTEPTVFYQLSQREREVLQLLAEGKTTKEIGDQLCVSIKTVETHRSHIMSKLDLRSVAELTKYAIREGITSL
jgi:DNA-binding NarL/FixJ family response regulator